MKKLAVVALLGAALALASCKAEKKQNAAAKNAGAQSPSADAAPAQAPAQKTDWLSVDSLKAVYVDSGIFENFGFAVSEFGLKDPKVMEGVVYHGTSVTAENAFKPDGLLYGLKANPAADFTSTKGAKIKVPDGLNFFTVDSYLQQAKELGFRMRGHVLVWHSQTPEAFFKKDFDRAQDFVSIEEMEARQEWYIKTVLEHVAEWEKANNGGEHIVYAWDVVNEAADDGANGDNFLRTGSNWYQIYKSDKFVVDAFRYANKYAPKDVLLAYNDYNEYQPNKHAAILRIIDDIQAAQSDKLPTRIDVAGMQSHMNTVTPSKGELENTIQSFIAKGLDIHITELDITGKWLYGNTCEKPTEEAQNALYKTAFELYKKYAKSGENPHGITGVTLWGVDDATSWRSSATPLLFKKTLGVYTPKTAFYAVIDAAKEGGSPDPEPAEWYGGA